MGVGMTAVMIFLMLLIACIEWVKYFNRNFTALELQTQKSHRKNEASRAVPVEVFAAAINAFEADNENS